MTAVRGWVVLGLVLAWVGGARGELRVETRPERPAPGEVFALRVSGALPGGGLEVRFGSRAFPLWRTPAGGWEGLAALDRDETSPSRDLVFVAVSEGAEIPVGVHELRVGTREYGVQEIFVDDAKVHLSPKDQERVDRENAAILAVLAVKSGERLWRPPFRLPVAGAVTGRFGVRRVYNGTPKGYHNGIDLSAPHGVPVGAAAAGRVALVGDYFMTGNTVVLDHGLGLQTAYFHMASAAVAVGDLVPAGGTVGLVGSTGRSTGPHLHWGVYLSGLRGDPESLLRLDSAPPP